MVENWLPRYTGVPLDQFGKYLLLTNFSGYLGHFARLTGAEVVGLDRPMPSATADHDDQLGSSARICSATSCC